MKKTIPRLIFLTLPTLSPRALWHATRYHSSHAHVFQLVEGIERLTRAGKIAHFIYHIAEQNLERANPHPGLLGQGFSARFESPSHFL